MTKKTQDFNLTPDELLSILLGLSMVMKASPEVAKELKVDELFWKVAEVMGEKDAVVLMKRLEEVSE